MKSHPIQQQTKSCQSFRAPVTLGGASRYPGNKHGKSGVWAHCNVALGTHDLCRMWLHVEPCQDDGQHHLHLREREAVADACARTQQERHPRHGLVAGGLGALQPTLRPEHFRVVAPELLHAVHHPRRRDHKHALHVRRCKGGASCMKGVCIQHFSMQQQPEQATAGDRCRAAQGGPWGW